MSQHLKKLEDEIRTQLFTRLHKRLVPTVAADRLFSIVNPFIEDLQSGLQVIKRAKVRPSGCCGSAPRSNSVKPISRYLCFLPEILSRGDLLSGTGDPEVLLAGLIQGTLDFALVDVFLANSRFQGQLDAYSMDPIIDEEVILACSTDYRDTVLNHDFSFDNLMAHDFITYQPRALALKGWFRHHFDKYAINPRIVLTVNSVQAVIEAVRQGVGMGVIASHLAYGTYPGGIW